MISREVAFSQASLRLRDFNLAMFINIEDFHQFGTEKQGRAGPGSYEVIPSWAYSSLGLFEFFSSLSHPLLLSLYRESLILAAKTNLKPIQFF